MPNLRAGLSEPTTAARCETAYYSNLTAITVETMETVDKMLPCGPIYGTVQTRYVHIHGMDAEPGDS